MAREVTSTLANCLKTLQIAPYTGFGTEEDSLTSCEGLEPRAPQRDFHKFMERDRDGFESHVLR